MKECEAECYVCHEVMNKHWMHHIGTGRKSYWLCPECYHKGGRQADYVVFRNNHPPRREGENIL